MPTARICPNGEFHLLFDKLLKGVNLDFIGPGRISWWQGGKIHYKPQYFFGHGLLKRIISNKNKRMERRPAVYRISIKSGKCFFKRYGVPK
jgi:hypothetical protein